MAGPIGFTRLKAVNGEIQIPNGEIRIPGGRKAAAKYVEEKIDFLDRLLGQVAWDGCSGDNAPATGWCRHDAGLYGDSPADVMGLARKMTQLAERLNWTAAGMVEIASRQRRRADRWRERSRSGGEPTAAEMGLKKGDYVLYTDPDFSSSPHVFEILQINADGSLALEECFGYVTNWAAPSDCRKTDAPDESVPAGVDFDGHDDDEDDFDLDDDGSPAADGGAR
jgi:hypothetical protein